MCGGCGYDCWGEDSNEDERDDIYLSVNNPDRTFRLVERLWPGVEALPGDKVTVNVRIPLFREGMHPIANITLVSIRSFPEYKRHRGYPKPFLRATLKGAESVEQLLKELTR